MTGLKLWKKDHCDLPPPTHLFLFVTAVYVINIADPSSTQDACYIRCMNPVNGLAHYEAPNSSVVRVSGWVQPLLRELRVFSPRS